MLFFLARSLARSGFTPPPGDPPALDGGVNPVNMRSKVAFGSSTGGIIIPGPLWMMAKIGALSFSVVWFRATFPRLREDQLQRFSWVVLVPLALADIMITAVLKVAF